MTDLKIGFTTKNKIIPEGVRTKYLPPPKNIEPAHTSTKNRPEGVKITLSLGAQALESASFQQAGLNQKMNTSQIGRGPLQELKAKLEQQLENDGENAELLTEIPDSQDPTRLELARQAIDFALTGKNNPFADISREKLSHIAYEDTGAFTSAERYAAFEEIDKRDSEYYQAVLQQKDYEITNGTLKDGMLFLVRAKYIVSQSMSEAERIATGEVSKDAHKLLLDSAETQGGTLPKQNIEYANLLSDKDQMVVSAIDNDGKCRWQTLSIRELIPKEQREDHLDIAAFLKKLGNPDKPSSFLANSAWITLYQRNEKFL